MKNLSFTAFDWLEKMVNSNFKTHYNFYRLCQMRTDASNNTGNPNSVKLYDLVAWFARFQWFSYLGMGFQLLSIELTMKFWHSIYYIGHLGLPIFYLIGISIFKPIVNKFLPTPSSSHQHQSWIYFRWFIISIFKILLWV